jgi:hypothetical protein
MVQHRCGIAQLTGGPPERVAPHDQAINAACLGIEIRSLNVLYGSERSAADRATVLGFVARPCLATKAFILTGEAGESGMEANHYAALAPLSRSRASALLLGD